jgi:hypothetical protein
MAYDPPADNLAHSYIIKGRGLFGACLDVQSKLALYGVCRFARWDPGPPHWRFLFDTHLNRQQTLAVLGASVDRWQVEVE